MIYIFRKEMRKWHTVLWVVLASLLIGGSVTMFYRRKHPSEMRVAAVNGSEISFKQYNRALHDINAQIEAYRNYARAYGIQIDLFLNLAGLKDPEKTAFDKCINDKLIDQEKDYFKIEIDPNFFGEQLLQRLPAQLKDPSGNLNMEAYKFFLSRSSTTIGEFEASKEDEFRRELFINFIEKSNYIPLKEVLQNFANDSVSKKFEILVLPFEKFLAEEKKAQVTKQELDEFFKKNKELYRVPEKRQAQYWIISPEKYAQKIEVDEQTIQDFYDKHKSDLYRIPPKIKVKTIIFNVGKGATPAAAEKVLENAKNAYKSLTQDPKKFDEFVAQFSGGVVDFFEKGTHDAEFEKAAFRLKNTGEISEIVKTKKGFEIIKLIDRIAASAKPFETVKNDIIKAIKVKREQNALRGDLERVLHEAKADENAISAFVQQNHLTGLQTDYLSTQDAAGKELKNLLADKLFSTKKQKGVCGYFVHDKEYVLYQVSLVKESYIPTFEQVEKNVLDDLQNDKAKMAIKAAARKARREILDGKTTLKGLSEKLGLRLVDTDSLKKNDEVKSLKLDKEFTERAFLLDDSKQVLSYKKDSSYYLTQLVQAGQPDMKKFQEEKNKLAHEALQQENRLYLSAFIASLLRNAKIEKTQEIFDTKNKNY